MTLLQERKELTMNDFYFVYSKPLAEFLYSRGFNKILIAVNPSNKQMYSLFHKTDQLLKVVYEYSNRN